MNLHGNKNNLLIILLKKVKAELKKLEEISEAIEAVSEQAEKHDLFSENLLEKFNELSELIKDIMPEDMFENINHLETQWKK